MNYRFIKYTLKTFIILNTVYFLFTIYRCYRLDVFYYRQYSTLYEGFLDNIGSSNLHEEFGVIAYLISMVLFFIGVAYKLRLLFLLVSLLPLVGIYVLYWPLFIK